MDEKSCRHCGMVLYEWEKTCPGCGARVHSPDMRWFVLFVFLFFLFYLVLRFG